MFKEMNEIYHGSTIQSLTAVDNRQMDNAVKFVTQDIRQQVASCIGRFGMRARTARPKLAVSQSNLLHLIP